MIPPEDDGHPLDAARGFFNGVLLGVVFWVVVALLLWGCSTPKTSQADLACVVEETLPWVIEHYAESDQGWPTPLVSLASQAELHQRAGSAVSAGSLIYGLFGGFGQIWIWDQTDLSNPEHQSTVVHELAHWVDFMSERHGSHDAVYALQQVWLEQHWPDGVCNG